MKTKIEDRQSARLARRGCVLASVLLGLSCLGAGKLRAQQRPVAVDTLRVTASSRASAAAATATRAVQVITAERIRRLPARSVSDVLDWGSGVDLMERSPALADVSLRGSSFEQVLVLVDGVPVNDRQTGHFDLDLDVPLAQVERIEIVRGPASALYGADAVGGLINIVTRTGGAPTLSAVGGSFGTAGLTGAGGFDLGTVHAELAGDWRRSDGHRPGTDYDIGGGRIGLTTPLAGRTLRADAGYAVRSFGADSFYGPYPSYERTRTATASVRLSSKPEARFSLDPVVSFRRHRDDFVLDRDDPGGYRNLHVTRELGIELTARYAATSWLNLAASAEGHTNQLRSESLGDRTENRGALSIEAAAGRVGRVTGTAGLRLDDNESFGSFLSPSLGVAWWPASRLRVRGSVGRSLRAPSWTERYYRDPSNIGDPNLRPERAWSTEMGADAYPGAGLRLGIGIFQRRARDLIDWARPVGEPTAPWHTRNVNDARFRGIEAELAVDRLAGVTWTAQATWLGVESSADAGLASKYSLRPLARQLSLTVERSFSTGLDFSVRAEQARRVGDSAYSLLGGRVAYRLSPARIFVDVRNATDTVYPDIIGADAAGRAVFLGVEWGGE